MGINRTISNIVADAGYESEENYVYLEENRQISYIKPQNYEISKTKKYRKNEFRVENMEYNGEKNRNAIFSAFLPLMYRNIITE